MARRGHFWAYFLTGAVALLPLLAVVGVAAYIEGLIAGTWLAQRAFYLPGMGIVLAVAVIYAFGLLLSTVAGRWAWGLVDGRLGRVPTLGLLYRTVQQLLWQRPQGQGLFKRVVLIGSEMGDELGFVTHEAEARPESLDSEGGAAEGSGRRLWVFVPAAPNPTVGRLLSVDAARVRPLPMSVAEGVRHIVSLGSAGRS